MKSRPRLKALAYSVSLAVAQIVSGSAHADTAVGQDTAMGNTLNPPGRSAVPRLVGSDSDVMGSVRHSPSGQLYGIPLKDEATTKTASGWEYSAGIEAGLLGGSNNKKNAKFREYKELKNGLYLNYVEAEAQNKESATYVQAFGGGTGMHDQFYTALFGHYNDWKVRVFFNETTHVFTDTWKSLYSGEGTGTLNHGLAMPVVTMTGNPTVGNIAGCTPLLPCWSYGGAIYSNTAGAGTLAVQQANIMAAINGTTGTPNAVTGVIPVGVIPTAVVVNGATNATQSNMAAAIAAKLAATPYSELALVRKKGGVRLDKNLTDSWKSYLSYTQEKRQGARPFAMNEGNISTEIAEPIDYTTHDLLAGLQYNDTLTQANLRASLSMFRNNIGVLNVQDILMSENSVNGAIQTATFDLYPNNDAFNLKGEFARELPDFFKGRFTAGLTWGTNRQDDALQAPISPAQNAQIQAAWAAAKVLNPALVPAVPTLPGASSGYAANSALVSNWNTVAALSQQTAKQRIDNKGVDLALLLKPTDPLSVKGTFRFFETDNKGGYTAYNPQTGQFGRGVADGNNLAALDTIVGYATPGIVPVITAGAGNCYIPPGYSNVPNTGATACTFGLVAANGANVPVFGQARSTRQTNVGLAGDYELTRTTSINAALEREYFRRNFRERDKTWEDKLKLGWVNRDLHTAVGDATLRASLETDRKRGGVYNYRTFEDLGTGLPGLDIATQVAKAGTAGYAALAVGLFNRYSYYFRKYDQADRNQNIINTRLNFSPRPDMDFGVMFQLKDAKYPNSFYGLQRDRQNTLNLELNYQPSTEQSFYAFYTYQRAKKLMGMNSGTAGAVVCNAALGNIVTPQLLATCADTLTGLDGARPFTSAWSTDSLDRNNVLGLGFQSDWRTMKFGVDYTYATSSTRINYGAGGTGFANAAGALTPALALAAAQNQAAMAALAGIALPNMTYSQNTLMFNLIVPIEKSLSARLLYRYEDMKIKDWHYDGVITGAMAAYDNGTLLLDAGPQNYHANTFGVMFQLKL